jgi:hypothetical protein
VGYAINVIGDEPDSPHDIVSNGQYYLGVSNSELIVYADLEISDQLVATTVKHNAPATVTTARISITGPGLYLVDTSDYDGAGTPVNGYYTEATFNPATKKEFPIVVTMDTNFGINIPGNITLPPNMITIELGNLTKEIKVTRNTSLESMTYDHDSGINYGDRIVFGQISGSRYYSEMMAVDATLPEWAVFTTGSSATTANRFPGAGAGTRDRIASENGGPLAIHLDRHLPINGLEENYRHVEFFVSRVDTDDAIQLGRIRVYASQRPTLQLWGGYADILYFDNDGRLQVGKWGVGNEITSIIQLAYFKFGSVIGIKYPATGTAFATNQIAFNPSKYTVGTATNVENTIITGYGSNSNVLPAIPGFVGGTGGDFISSNSTNISSPAYHNGTNIRIGKGDPCKLVGFDIYNPDFIAKSETEKATALGAYDSGWRLPTARENVNFIGGTLDTSNTLSETHRNNWINWRPGNGGFNYSAVTTPTGNGAYTWPYFYSNAGSRITSGGSATAPSTVRLPVVTDPYNVEYSQIVPAGGFRYFTGGEVYYPGSNAAFWSSTPTNNNQYGYRFLGATTLSAVSSSEPSYGLMIRCVRDDQNPFHLSYTGD